MVETIDLQDTEVDIDQTSVHDAETLLQRNNIFYQKFTKRPFFKMISSGILNEDEKRRTLFFDYMQIFADFFQTMMQMRQASCSDERFSRVFFMHFLDEMGHDQLFRQRQQVAKVWDPILVSVATWFVHQMQILDNIEKAVVMHLVVEKTGDFYHTIGHKQLAHYLKSNYYEIHKEHDENHVAMVMDLIFAYPPFVYQRLGQLLEQAWLMMYTKVDRVYTLVMTEV